MNINSYEMLVSSLAMDIRRGTQVSFLFGSAISLPDTGLGMPSVTEMVDLIRDYLAASGDDGLDEYINSKKDISAYQAAFTYLFGVGSQEDVKEILLTAVNRAKDENDKWIIPKSINDFANLVSKKSLNLKHILTTNFDPLIEVALEESGYDINMIELTEDLTFDSGRSHNNERINVIHLHGYYDGDTMHTPDQLKSNRDECISCLKRILHNSKLYVVGYGGWDDIINQTLIEMITEKKQKYDVRWAYYSNNEREINTNNDDFFKKINAAQTRARFSAYKSVDCKNLFEDAYKSAHKVSITIEDDSAENEPHSDKKKIITLTEIYKPQKKSDPINLKEFFIRADPSHRLIRVTEQENARQYLENDGSFTLISGWGYGKLDFAASLISHEFDSYIIYRIDCYDVHTRNEMEMQFRKDIGLDFTTLVAAAKSEKVTVFFFDNITDLKPEILDYFNEISSIIKDEIGYVRAIFFTNAPNEIANSKIILTPLNLADIHEYVKNSVPYKISVEQLEFISRRSSGLPAKLDLMKEYFRVSSINHALSRSDEEFITDEGVNTDSIPSQLLDLINEFSKSESPENKRCFYLLQVLCIVECGETAENITRFFHQKKFLLNDFIRLESHALTHSTKISSLKDCTIHRINTLIKDFVKSKISVETIEIIRKTAIKMVCGDIWYNRTVSISGVTTALLDYINNQPGNAHILLTDLLKKPIDPRHLDIYRDASVSYSYFLSRNTRYKETISFVNEILPFFQDENEISYLKLIDYLTESMRMVDKEDEVISLLEKTLKSYTPQSKNFIKHLHESMMATLLLCYAKTDKDKSFSMADSMRKDSDKNTHKRFLCDMVLTGKFSDNEKSAKLKRLEKNARNHKQVTLANNICLDLAKLDPVNSKDYINTVLSSENSNYTKVRAILGKTEGLLLESTASNLNSSDFLSLSNCYKYLFIQRIDGLFNKCHDLLWKIFLSEHKIEELFNVYVSSSLVWRVSGRQDKEIIYNKVLIELLQENSSLNPAYLAYLSRRDKLLTKKNEKILNLA
ncbi:SIR2 family protein [Pantoea allii]|uniref:SIR2 family protein n=1 Tax=Pantoea TaxID=53335 RepID=UPI0032089A07